MNDQNIKDIVDELIAHEPALAKHRKILLRQISAIVAAKPDTRFSSAFKQRLLKDIRLQIPSKFVSSSPFLSMNKFLYAFGGAAVASLVLFITVIHPVVPGLPGGPALPSLRDDDSAMAPANALSDEAFGNLVADDSGSPRPQSGGGGPAIGLGGGGMPPMMDTTSIAPDSKMIAPYPDSYTAVEYSYEGTIDLGDQTSVTVLRRIPANGSSNANLLGGTFVSDVLDVSTLGALNVINVTLSESGPEPLNVYTDFVDGSLSINRQTDYSLRPDANCKDDVCFQQHRLKESDMLADEKAIEIASAFLRKLGVNAALYGEPSLLYDWRTQRAMMPVSSDFYYPESIEVSFPYLLSGTPVYDEWGNPVGVNVTVDVRLRTATGVYGLRTMQMESSEYAAVTDPAVLKEAIAEGGNNMWIPEDATRIQATLSDPKQVFLRYYKYDQEKQLSYELYVPALAFPVKAMPEGSYEQRKAVVVPLAAELLQTGDDRMIKPMPMDVPTAPPSGIMMKPMEDGVEE